MVKADYRIGKDVFIITEKNTLVKIKKDTFVKRCPFLHTQIPIASFTSAQVIFLILVAARHIGVFALW